MVRSLLELFQRKDIDTTHRTYVEPFGGGAVLIMAKPPSLIEVYNDEDSGLVELFRLVRSDSGFEWLKKRDYSGERLNSLTWCCKRAWMDCEDKAERAYRWLNLAWTALFEGVSLIGDHNVYHPEHEMFFRSMTWLSEVRGLREVHRRVMRVQIEHLNYRRAFQLYDTPGTLFYCEPPYVAGSSGCPHTLPEDEHRELVQILLGLQGKVILACKEHEVYRPLADAGWKWLAFPPSEVSLAAVDRADRSEGWFSGVWLSPNMLKVEKQTEEAPEESAVDLLSLAGEL